MADAPRGVSRRGLVLVVVLATGVLLGTWATGGHPSSEAPTPAPPVRGPEARVGLAAPPAMVGGVEPTQPAPDAAPSAGVSDGRAAPRAPLSWARRRRQPLDASAGGPYRLVPDVGGPIRSIVVQYSHASILETVVDIIRGVPFARVIVATPSIQDGIQLRVELDAVGGLPRALDLVVASEGLTPWVRDAFLALRDPFGRMRLEVRPLNPVLEDREADREVPELLARRLRASVDVDYPALYFEGGNVVSDERWAFVGANTMEYNTADTTIRFRSDLEVRLFHLLGRPVVLVGSQDDPAPLDHLDMLMTPLGRRRVAVGDLRLGLSILDGLSPQRQQQLEELFSARTGMYGGRSFSFRAFLAYNRAGARAEAFDRVAQALEARGFDVVRMPLLTGGLDAGFPVMTYQNVVQDEVGGRRRALVPQYRVEELDAAAREAWRAVGYEPVAVDAFSVVDLVGAVRCLSNVIDRAPSMRPPRASVRPGLLAPPRSAPAPPPPAAIRG